MKRLLLACAFFTTACGPSVEELAATFVAETAAVEPTATLVPTAIPLSDVDLEIYLIEEGDLPRGIRGAQIRDFAPRMYRDVPAAINTVYQQFERRDGDFGGHVVVFLYDTNMQEAFEILVNIVHSTDTSPIEGVGESAFGHEETSSLSVAFIRCHAVVHFSFSETANRDNGIGYAKRLDERLTPLVCPE